MNDRHRFRVVCCGRRFGKSTLAILEMIGKAASKDDCRVAYLANTYQQARDIAWQELKKLAGPIILDANESRLEIKVKNKFGGSSVLVLRGWEAVETLRGQKFDMVVIDEIAMMRNFWEHWQEVIRPTLADTKGEVLFLSTPKGFNHFYDLFNLQEKDSDFKSFHFSTYDNPFIDKAEIDQARKHMTEDRFSQEFMADFRKSEGLVYKEFSRKSHIFTSERPLAVLDTLIGIDWGYTNPTAVLRVVRDADNNYWVMEEWYKRGKTTEEVIPFVFTLKGNYVYPDPAEPDRNEMLRRAGLNVQEVNKDVEAGIDSVRELFKNNKIKIHSSCVNLINELETYSYRIKKTDQNDPEEPIKENDHALDALRYVIHMQSFRFLGTVAHRKEISFEGNFTY